MCNDIKVLIIEDDNDINELLGDILLSNGYKIKSAYSGTEGLHYFNNEEFHLVLLDLMLPGKSGSEVLKELRDYSNIPIIVISAKEEEGLRASHLRAGADDFISKPFDIDEVVARVEANLRRYLSFNLKDDLAQNEIRYKEILLNKDTREVFINKNKITLTALEFEILELLIGYPNKVFSKSNLFKSIWGEEYICDDNTITVHISNLRTKISKTGAKEGYIKTIWGIGYKLSTT